MLKEQWSVLEGPKMVMKQNGNNFRAVVVAQLVERSLPVPELRSSNPVIGKKLFILKICLLSTVY